VPTPQNKAWWEVAAEKEKKNTKLAKKSSVKIISTNINQSSNNFINKSLVSSSQDAESEK
jgi:hypothetical protein